MAGNANSGHASNWKYGIKHQSILEDYDNQIELDDNDFNSLYRFYVLNAPYPKHSFQGRSFPDYGWTGSISQNGLGKALDSALSENSGLFYLPGKDTGVKLASLFQQAGLHDGLLSDIDRERAAITLNTKKGTNNYLRLFRHVRNCFAHGRFILVSTELNPDGVFVMEDRDSYNITARIVLRKRTLLDWSLVVSAGPNV